MYSVTSNKERQPEFIYFIHVYLLTKQHLPTSGITTTATALFQNVGW